MAIDDVFEPLSKTLYRQRPMVNVPVWSLPRMSSESQGTVDLPKPLGMPLRAFRLVLDTHLRRRRNSTNWGQGQTPSQNLLRALATTRKATRQQCSDPILWLYRTRWIIAATSLSLSYLQSGRELPDPGSVPPWPTEDQVGYRPMAAWAYRHCGSESKHRELCLEILVQAQSGRPQNVPGTQTTVLKHQTYHWFLWYLQARSKSRDESVTALRRTGLHSLWGEEETPDPDSAPTISGRIPEWVWNSITTASLSSEAATRLLPREKQTTSRSIREIR